MKAEKPIQNRAKFMHYLVYSKIHVSLKKPKETRQKESPTHHHALQIIYREKVAGRKKQNKNSNTSVQNILN